MKIYRYHPTTGVSLGEDFIEEEREMEPAGVTTVPPPEHRPGEIAVFDRGTGQWTTIARGSAEER